MHVNFLRLLFVLVSVVIFGKFVRSDDYLDEIQGQCHKNKKVLTCAKYKVFRYLNDYRLRDYNLTSDSSVRIIGIPDNGEDNNSDDAAGFTQTRQLPDDPEYVKIFKFLKRQVERVLSTQGLTIQLPEGARVLETGRKEGAEARIKKKKGGQSIVVPLLTLLTVFKIKIMTSLILGTVLLITKALIVAAFFIPGLIASIKAHCKAQQYHVVPYHVEDDHHIHHDHDHDDITATGYGVSGYGSDSHKAWERIHNKRLSLG